MESEVYTQTGTSAIKTFLVKGTFDDDMLGEFLTFHTDCIRQGVTEAFLYVDSPGGYCHTFSSMQALMRDGNVTYHTIALGHACSCGCLLMAMGNIRWASPEASFMFHDASSVSWGKQKEMKESIEDSEKMLSRLLKLYASQTKMPLEFWMEKSYARATGDLYFSADEALEWGVVDFIGLPVVGKNTPFYVDLPVTPEQFKDKISFRDTPGTTAMEIHKEPKKKVAKKKVVSKKAKKKVVKKKVVKKTTKNITPKKKK